MLGGKLTVTDADLIFAKVKAKGARKITFAQFEKAIPDLAARKGISAEEFIATLSASQGPGMIEFVSSRMYSNRNSSYSTLCRIFWDENGGCKILR